MASSVFFKFKSQKEPIRVEFDGTGISVFELKRDIIIKSGLGDGTDFDLAIYTDDGRDEYDDDTTIIPRSTTVVARRLPPIKPGAGRAARYVSGKMPIFAKNSSRKEQAVKAATKAAASSAALAQMNTAQTEEEKMAAMFQAQTEQWSAQQEEMSHQQPVFLNPAAKRKLANVPDHDPPQGYICYRCGEKGHWIQLCPTNDNPEFDNRPRVKRTTGIPKSFLKTVDKATALAQYGEGDDSKTPSGIMVNADGDYVVAEPDKASWEQFQAKAKSTAASKGPAPGDKEVQERGLECPIDKKMFIDPMKTPCCEKTYCNDCITNALIESDFVCPGCQTEGVLIDDLKPDDEAANKIKEYLSEKDNKAKEASKSPAASPKSPVMDSAKPADVKAEQGQAEVKTKPNSPPAESPPVKSPPPQVSPTTKPASTATTTTNSAAPASGDSVSKKRPAEEPAENPRAPRAPKAMQNTAQSSQDQAQLMQQMMNNGMPMMPNMQGMPMMPFGGMPMMPGFGGMGNMGGMGMMNPMMNPMMGGMNGFGMNGGGGGGGFANGAMWDGSMGGGMNMNMNMNGGGMMGGGMNGQGGYNQQYQQPMPNRNFSQQGGGDGEDDAYFRKPVNPHRHQNKQRRVRPSDYREL